MRYLRKHFDIESLKPNDLINVDIFFYQILKKKIFSYIEYFNINISRELTMTSSEIPLNEIKLPNDYKPSEDEEFMNPMQLAYFRKKLLNWKNELVNGASDTILGLSEETLQKPDAADRAQLEADASIVLRARDRERKLISKIESALRRIEDGSYGYCQDTDEPINLKRLEARPIASLSLDAQEKHERMEKVHRED